MVGGCILAMPPIDYDWPLTFDDALDFARNLARIQAALPSTSTR
jgi:hypothetical protein